MTGNSGCRRRSIQQCTPRDQIRAAGARVPRRGHGPVRAISLNRGEVNRAVRVAEPGCGRAGTSSARSRKTAPEGGGPAKGHTRRRHVASGAWAETIRAPKDAVAALPDGVTDAQAATLPVAGLTAATRVAARGLLLGRKVLIDGASAGSAISPVSSPPSRGRSCTAMCETRKFQAMVAEWCGERTIVAPDLTAAAAHAPFHLILDSVGGSPLGAALGMLRPGGTCVTFGVSESPNATFDSGAFFRGGATRLYGLILFHELKTVEPASEGLALLAGMIARERYGQGLRSKRRGPRSAPWRGNCWSGASWGRRCAFGVSSDDV